MHTKLFENSLFVATLVAVSVAVSVSVLVCRTSKFNNSFFAAHISQLVFVGEKQQQNGNEICNCHAWRMRNLNAKLSERARRKAGNKNG